jgi:uncharacterized membrane protein YfcA
MYRATPGPTGGPPTSAAPASVAQPRSVCRRPLVPAGGRWHHGAVETSALLAYGPGVLFGLAATAFVGGCLNGTTGLGFATVVAVALALLLDARRAVILLSGITPLIMLMPVLQYRAQLPHARRLLPLFAATPPGVLLGTYLLLALPVAAIALGLGLVTVITILFGLSRGELTLPEPWQRPLMPVVGLIAGAANSAVGVSGPILGLYLLALRLERPLFAFTVAAMFACMGLLRLVTLLLAGELSPATLAISLALCVPAMLGVRAGFWLQRRIDQKVFNRLVLLVLLVAGVQLIYRGLGDLHVLGP